MSKRHQSSRRKSYGRRQHELRERREHVDLDQVPGELEVEDVGTYEAIDRFAFLDAGRARVRYAISD